MTDRELMQQALDALETEHSALYGNFKTQRAVEALRARLAQPEPEPVAWQSRMRPDWEENGWTQWKDCTKQQANDYRKRPQLHDWVYEARALYLAPPQRSWQGLTDEEKQTIYRQADAENWDDQPLLETVEAKLREKNNG